MAVKIEPSVYEALTKVLERNCCNMIDWRCVHAALLELGEEYAADWLEANVEAYIRGLSQGFEPEKPADRILH